MQAAMAEVRLIPRSCNAPITYGVSEPMAAPAWNEKPGPTPRTPVGNRSVRYDGAMPQMPVPQIPINSAPSHNTPGLEDNTKIGMIATPSSAAMLTAPRRPSRVSDARPQNAVPM